MSIAFINTGIATRSAGPTTQIQYPGTQPVGCMIVLACMSRGGAPLPPAGYQGVVRRGGVCDPGPDAGQVYSGVFWKIADAADAAAVVNQDFITLEAPGSTLLTGRTWSYSKDDAKAWDTCYASAEDGGPGTAWVATADALIDVAAGDLLLANNALNTDTIAPLGGNSLSAPGVTFGPWTLRTSTTNGNGDDGRLHMGESPVTAGAATGPVKMAMAFGSSTPTAPAGACTFLRLREV